MRSHSSDWLSCTPMDSAWIGTKLTNALYLSHGRTLVPLAEQGDAHTRIVLSPILRTDAPRSMEIDRQASNSILRSESCSCGAHLVDGQAIIVQVAALLIQGVPRLMDGSSQPLGEVIVLEAGGHSDIGGVGPCSCNRAVETLCDLVREHTRSWPLHERNLIRGSLPRRVCKGSSQQPSMKLKACKQHPDSGDGSHIGIAIALSTL